MNVISPWRLRQMADELIIEVFEHIKGTDSLKELDNAPGLSIQSNYPEDINASSWAEPSKNA